MWSSNYYSDLSDFLALGKFHLRASKELADKTVKLLMLISEKY